jgi:hypothetical protein
MNKVKFNQNHQNAIMNRMSEAAVSESEKNQPLELERFRSPSQDEIDPSTELVIGHFTLQTLLFRLLDSSSWNAAYL